MVVCFVIIGGIVDHHCLKARFINDIEWIADSRWSMLPLRYLWDIVEDTCIGGEKAEYTENREKSRVHELLG